MSKLVSQDSYYRLWVEELCTRFENARLRAATKVNAELLRFYWSVGEDLVKRKTSWNRRLFPDQSWLHETFLHAIFSAG